MSRTSRFLLAMFILIAAAAMPRAAQARAVSCDPQGNCYTSAFSCDTLRSPPSTLPKGWTCTDKFIINPRLPNVIRNIDGRTIITANGKPIVVLSDALNERMKRQRPTPAEFARLVRADRGSVSAQRLSQVSKDFGIAIAKTAEKAPVERAKPVQ